MLVVTNLIGLTVLGRGVSSGSLAETQRVEWEGQATADILADLVRAMRTAGLAAEVVGEPMFVNVETALRQLRRSWTGEETWFEGPVWEWLNDDWVITQQGLVRRGHGLWLRYAAQATFRRRGHRRAKRTVPDTNGVRRGLLGYRSRPGLCPSGANAEAGSRTVTSRLQWR